MGLINERCVCSQKQIVTHPTTSMTRGEADKSALHFLTITTNSNPNPTPRASRTLPVSKSSHFSNVSYH